jgi:hypothetical protein
MARQLDIPENKVAIELSRFADVSLLSVMSMGQWDRRSLYLRTPENTGYWQLGHELVQRAAAEEGLRLRAGAGTAMQAYLDEVHGRVT